MSEYQYYEFQAIDRPLTREQMNKLRGYSSRARITPNGFAVDYNWGDFKGDAKAWMEQYFDAHVHLANWGTLVLMLRVPQSALDLKTAEAYCSEYYFEAREAGDSIVLEFTAGEIDVDWVEGDGWMASLVPLRSELMQGDYRCLYLGWLSGALEQEYEDDELEPPVPPGLGKLSASLTSLADFLDIDPDLIAAAAEGNNEIVQDGPSRDEVAQWVAALPIEEKDSALVAAIHGEGRLLADLKHRAMRALREGKGGGQFGARRTVGELIARADVIEEARKKTEKKKQKEEAAKAEKARLAARKKYVDSLVGKEEEIWGKVEELAGLKKASSYNEAVDLLEALHELAVREGKANEFRQKIVGFRNSHQRKSALIARIQNARLLER